MFDIFGSYRFFYSFSGGRFCKFHAGVTVRNWAGETPDILIGYGHLAIFLICSDNKV